VAVPSKQAYVAQLTPDTKQDIHITHMTIVVAHSSEGHNTDILKQITKHLL